MKAYLAGPMRSKPQFNYPLFMGAAKALRAVGWEIFNPAEMDLEAEGTDLSMSLDDQHRHAGTPLVARVYAHRDVNTIIHRLKAEDGDAIIVLPDWEESIGAKAEVAVATWVRLPTYTVTEAIDAISRYKANR